MNYNPFGGKGSWFKGNLHCHSTHTDGTYSPAELKEIYKRNGYHFIAFTDHDVYLRQDQLNEPDFLAFPGTEIKSFPEYPNPGCGDYRAYHLLCLHAPDAVRAQCKGELISGGERFQPVRATPDVFYEESNALVARIQDRGCLVGMSHPVWSRLMPEDILGLRGCWGIEIYNGQNAVDGEDSGEVALYWDALLRRGVRIWGYAADDNHNKDYKCCPNWNKIDESDLRWPSCKGWVMVWADELSINGIAHALYHGHFYSSTGPNIHRYELLDGKIFVECDKVARIDFVSYERRSYSLTARDGVTGGAHSLTGDEKYVRVQITAFDGTKAWTNPIFPRDHV